MAKVGILTFHYANNYGAVLQAYGLAKAVQELGHEVEIIDYRPLAARRMYNRIARRPTRILPSLMHLWRFDRFRRKHLPLSRTYLSMNDLKKYPPQVDYVVCGSDQIWNISSFRGFDPVFFLAHLDLSMLCPKRISYAATFGNAESLGEHHSQICGLLSRFEQISVRDAKSQKMIEELVGRAAVHVLDPSFLTNYDSITPNRLLSVPYVFAYLLDKSEFVIQAIRLVRDQTGLPIVLLGAKIEGERVQRVGPLQWLSLIKHADFVLTNSFHGTCFALKNQKHFVMLPKEGGMSRLEDILQTANLRERLVTNPVELQRALNVNIDYRDVSVKLEQARERSLNFLRNALES